MTFMAFIALLARAGLAFHVDWAHKRITIICQPDRKVGGYVVRCRNHE